MAGTLQRREDGSIALFINGDLQFDSVDESIYHESLALPALALAARRSSAGLKVLVIGGGDGLVARELFKSDRVATLDLVDYDPEILSYARSEFSQFNANSLSDPRMTVHVQDAWEFVSQPLADNALYDLIVSDLTVPEDIAGARFHSVEWYAHLSRILTPNGIIAVNAVSPQATPHAYWSIFNGLARVGLQARPYHVTIPSFSALGYGQDWGFFIASATPIVIEEMNEGLVLAEPRRFLQNTNALRQFFVFPEESFACQAEALPSAVGSDILLHYFTSGAISAQTTSPARDALTIDFNSLVIPEPHSGTNILSPALSSMLARSLYAQDGPAHYQPEDGQAFLHEVLSLMPPLQREQTSELIAEFLEEPAVFLQAIDLPGLVQRLLKRAADLPANVVAELELLRDKLDEWAGDHLSLLSLGSRVITILTLVIVIGNLLFPDMVYAKGEAHAASASHASGKTGSHTATHTAGRATGVGGVRGAGWYGGRYWSGTRWDYTRKRILPANPKSSIKQTNNISSAQCVDEKGNVYPARRYRVNSTLVSSRDVASDAVVEHSAVYRLGPGTDVLSSGHVVMPLTEQSYLLVGTQSTHVIDQRDGSSVLALQNNPTLINLTRSEIDRQLNDWSEGSVPDAAGITGGAGNLPASNGIPGSAGNLPASAMAQQAVVHLTAASDMLSGVKLADRHDMASPVVPGLWLFPGVWMTGDGKFVAAKLENGQPAYINGQGWYHDFGTTPIAEPYPERFQSVSISYLSKLVRTATSKMEKLVADQVELRFYADMLTEELASYERSSTDLVHYGTRQIPRSEAVRLTKLAIMKTEHKIGLVMRHIDELPMQIDLAKTALANLKSDRTV